MTGEGAAGASNEISGGTFHGPVLQGGSFTGTTFVIQQAPAAPVALGQLPPPAAGFTGREAELAQVATLLDPAAKATAGTVVVSAVAGLAGVGKTALAVQAAYAAVSSGWFPGGVLFIDLHGYDEAPVQPGQVLDSLLRALGVPGEHIPEGTEQRTVLYRSALAQILDPVLVIADNASAEAQVRPLIPGRGPHRVVITSRHTLAGLGARLLDVTVLDEAEAVALLDKVVRAARPDDDRIRADGAAAGRLAVVCAGLPLALQISAALLVADPALAPGELAGALDDEVRRVETLRCDDGGGVGAPSVAAAFELSYRRLDEDAARLFRLLPASPGPDASTAAAAELAGWPVDRARAVIGRLARAHLVEAAGRPGRWRMHDLLRLYARQLSEADQGDRDQATGRVLDYYLSRTDAADDSLRALAGQPMAAEFTGRDDALAWLDEEWPNLIAAVTVAAATGRDQIAMCLPLILSDYALWRRRFGDWLAVLAVSRDCARRRSDRAREAASLDDLGLALRNVRRFEESISAHQDAIAIYRETGDRYGEGTALNRLGGALREVRRFEESINAHQDAIAIYRETGNRRGEGTALNNIGLAMRHEQRFEESINAHQDAVAIYRETGDRHGEGAALSNLGVELAVVRRFKEAISALQDAIAIYREAGDRHGEGTALDSLGMALAEVRRFAEAISAHQDAVVIFREAGDRHGEGMALHNLGAALVEVRRFEEAIDCFQQDVAICWETGDLYGAGHTLRSLGSTYKEMRRPDQATTYWRQAAAAMRDAGEPEEAARLEQLAANIRTRRRWWRTSRSAVI
jgi:tetratricopeptide (TPR) repeat protein